MNREFIIAFKDVMREQFVNQNRVELEGLGQFEVVHKEQYQKTFDNGKVVMMPPEDVLEFKSNIRISYDN
jgi:nucleoid DNA-binding protein